MRGKEKLGKCGNLSSEAVHTQRTEVTGIRLNPSDQLQTEIGTHLRVFFSLLFLGLRCLHLTLLHALRTASLYNEIYGLLPGVAGIRSSRLTPCIPCLVDSR